MFGGHQVSLSLSLTGFFGTREGGVRLGQFIPLSITVALCIACWDHVLSPVAVLNKHALLC